VIFLLQKNLVKISEKYTEAIEDISEEVSFRIANLPHLNKSNKNNYLFLLNKTHQILCFR